ncbi:hypothetical protein DYB32_006430 [Aphanomyces invadans]|uniref:Uncharacterized protein n=1 Tax=Aphanomyces invadans TaxID=157072 RepID=A0A418ARF8_9STRA|nr:hypothetical protein DYB32_006430 [Aphanomyces invadans]
MDATLARMDEAMHLLQRRMDIMERKIDLLPNRILPGYSRQPSATSPLSSALTTRSHNSNDHGVTNHRVTQTSPSSSKRHADGRAVNPRTLPETYISLAVQRAQAPPRPKHPGAAKRPKQGNAIPFTSEPPETSTISVPDLHFAWQDGSFRRAPESWIFPMTTSRVMWEFWFQGCPEPRMGPFRLLKKADLCTGRNNVQMSQARGVMKKLVEIAVSLQLVPSAAHLEEMPRFKSMAIFDQAYAVLSTPAALEHLTDVLPPDRSPMYPYRHIYEHLIKDKHKVGVDVQGRACRQDASMCAMVPWQFPSTNCQAMWMHWFKGDPAHDIGPFRHLHGRDVDRFGPNDRRTRKLLSSARVLMEKLVDIAVEAKLVGTADELDALDSGPLEQVFHDAFDRMLSDSGVNLDPQVMKKAKKYTYSTVYFMMTPSQRMRSPVRGDLDENEYNDENYLHHHEDGLDTTASAQGTSTEADLIAPC